ncbi:type 4a pilus biogenesis protein PilO [Nitrospira sp. Kam-Ns4a]
MGRFSPHLSPPTRLALRGLLPLALLAALAVGTAAGMAIFVWDPARARRAAAESLYSVARQDQARQKAMRKTLEDLADVWRGLPLRTEFPALILAVSELAQRDRVVIPGMTYSMEKVEHEQVLKASMTFRAAGEYGAIRRFIHRIETMGSYVVIESLVATRGKDAHQVEFSIRAVTFLRPDQGPSGNDA